MPNWARLQRNWPRDATLAQFARSHALLASASHSLAEFSNLLTERAMSGGGGGIAGSGCDGDGEEGIHQVGEGGSAEPASDKHRPSLIIASVRQTDCDGETDCYPAVQGVSCLLCYPNIFKSPVPSAARAGPAPNMLPEKRGLATFRKLNVPPLCGTHYKSEGFMASSRCRSVLKTAFMPGSDFPGSRKGSTLHA